MAYDNPRPRNICSLVNAMEYRGIAERWWYSCAARCYLNGSPNSRQHSMIL